ncbi:MULTISPECIES: hypothetical protein [Streptomyces]|uniref:hypothetical protein n=1 Tax=Streptomyces TaxID=1883 RepID=UPI001F3E1C75|nr:hypothetical protein [Streptomyces olivochromogenes]MCF3135063.1 hypothetical protein [Streptomyces olivochromogenes]
MSENNGTDVVPLTRKNKVGLVLAGLLGLLDTTNFFSIPAQEPDTPGPPTAILVADGVLGVITVIAVVYTWRTLNRAGSRVVAGSRILSVITALPALFVGGVPAWVVLVVAVFTILSVVVIALVLTRPAPEAAVR